MEENLAIGSDTQINLPDLRPQLHVLGSLPFGVIEHALQQQLFPGLKDAFIYKATFQLFDSIRPQNCTEMHGMNPNYGQMVIQGFSPPNNISEQSECASVLCQRKMKCVAGFGFPGKVLRMEY